MYSCFIGKPTPNSSQIVKWKIRDYEAHVSCYDLVHTMGPLHFVILVMALKLCSIFFLENSDNHNTNIYSLKHKTKHSNIIILQR